MTIYMIMSFIMACTYLYTCAAHLVISSPILVIGRSQSKMLTL